MYEPTAIPSDAPIGLRAWLAAQLRQIANALAAPEVNGLRFTPLAAEPERYQTGDVVFADGTNWNPGGTGAGLYERRGGGWHKL
jgi:hypothetical protein